MKVPYLLVAALAPLMAQRGTEAIVNLSTMVAEYGAPSMSLYGSSKAAINLLTKVWAAEYGPRGVRVNAVDVSTLLTALAIVEHFDIFKDRYLGCLVCGIILRRDQCSL